LNKFVFGSRKRSLDERLKNNLTIAAAVNYAASEIKIQASSVIDILSWPVVYWRRAFFVAGVSATQIGLDPAQTTGSAVDFRFAAQSIPIRT
jgi:hypothetical protein